MTSSADAPVDEGSVAPVASGLLMVGASGAVCVDGVCIIEPTTESVQQGGRGTS